MGELLISNTEQYGKGKRIKIVKIRKVSKDISQYA